MNDRHDNDRPEYHTHIHTHVHTHTGGDGNAEILAVLARIEQKIGALADIEGTQQKLNALTSELKQRNDELAAAVAAQPKE